MKKILAILLAMVMTFGLLTGCNKSQSDKTNGDNSDIVIGVVVNNLEHVFFNRIKAGMEEKAAELGVTLKLIDGAGDSAVQMAAVQDFIAAGVDAIAVAWCNTDGSGSIVELAAGTKLNVVASLTSGSTQVGTIAAIEKAGRYTYYVIQIA